MNALQIINSTPTKINMEALVNEYLNSEGISPLNKYLNLKAVEYMVKYALADKSFRETVKDDYLKMVEGALSRVYVLGVEIKTASQEKKNKLNKFYMYSDNVVKLEKEVETLERELSLKKDLLKGTKLLEIDNGTAQELIKDTKEENVLDSFNLVISFKNE